MLINGIPGSLPLNRYWSYMWAYSLSMEIHQSRRN